MLPERLHENVPVHDANVVAPRDLRLPGSSQFVVELDEDEPAYGTDEMVRERASAFDVFW